MNQPGQLYRNGGGDESTGSTIYKLYRNRGKGMNQPGQLYRNYIEMGGGDESTGSTI